MGKKRFIKSLPHVNTLLPPLRYQLNWTNGIACVIALSISQSNNNDTWILFVEACLLRPSLDCFYVKKGAKRSPKPKQIGTSDYCRICGCFVYVNSTGQSSHKANRADNFFLESCSWRCYKTKVGGRFKRSWFYRFANRKSVKQHMLPILGASFEFFLLSTPDKCT